MPTFLLKRAKQASRWMMLCGVSVAFNWWVPHVSFRHKVSELLGHSGVNGGQLGGQRVSLGQGGVVGSAAASLLFLPAQVMKPLAKASHRLLQSVLSK
jgi:hypothetical protein